MCMLALFLVPRQTFLEPLLPLQVCTLYICCGYFVKLNLYSRSLVLLRSEVGCAGFASKNICFEAKWDPFRIYLLLEAKKITKFFTSNFPVVLIRRNKVFSWKPCTLYTVLYNVQYICCGYFVMLFSTLIFTADQCFCYTRVCRCRGPDWIRIHNTAKCC
jgi:hypothetical protein